MICGMTRRRQRWIDGFAAFVVFAGAFFGVMRFDLGSPVDRRGSGLVGTIGFLMSSKPSLW